MRERRKSNKNVDMTSPSTATPPTDVSPSTKAVTTPRGGSAKDISSSPLNLRITSSQGRPLFPNLPKHPKMPDTEGKKTAGFVKPEDDKKDYKWNSMAEMISAHVEELKERPPLGTPKEGTKQGDKVDGESQQTLQSKGKGKEKAI
ncbi:uncharacterized protein F4807DRAFT_241610 [Annulohypoxylon truncatum]|uniref:uncharacterized protein n=1 Tax=Annulohypoxylon truncatum TaxID=327061 RepID=UPI002008C5AE|nr:uncharacterized protein F4807DRAFT_241610 [Annulohypoxylon truncatum]KAI1206223.1 hypothetical protein F4807DRAFT_241610 [Annulohypoxylon truncatum]